MAMAVYMRAVMEVPEGRGYVLGDLLVDGNPLEYGGQIADYIKVSLTGRTSDTGGNNQIDPPRKCSEAPTHGPDRPPGPQESGTSFAAVAALGTDHMALGLSKYR
ncbi:hypothetical protein BDZ89DRAFT_1147760 [Hymenopellis radicata]|nr:hypothetical protein BDZ89DRAFT_1147760 [Hymenopellis radicata]